MAEAERVAEFVSRDLEEIGASAAADGPLFGVVKVSIAAVHREVSVSQGVSRSVEGIAVAVLVLLETDLNVHRVRALRRECQVCVFAPDSERSGDLLVNLCPAQTLRILGDPVGQALHLPPAALQGVPFRPRVGAEANLVLNATPWLRHQMHRLVIELARRIQSREALEILDRLRPCATI